MPSAGRFARVARRAESIGQRARARCVGNVQPFVAASMDDANGPAPLSARGMRCGKRYTCRERPARPARITAWVP